MASTSITTANSCAHENNQSGCTNLNVNDNNAHHPNATSTNGNGDAPFEWLTNFASLRHLILPSRIAFGPLSSTLPLVPNETALTNACDDDSLTPLQKHDLGSSNDEWEHREQDDRRQCIKLNALHVGCGTSTVGESLLYLTERVSVYKGDSASESISQPDPQPQHYKLHYGHVVNVDIDNAALSTMQKRWELLNLKQTRLDRKMEWRHVDFHSEESCRVALDPLYQTASSICSMGCFDLVLDKSTLDCLLCSESDAVAGLLCEVYRALRIPSSIPMDRNEKLDHPSRGGVYVLITFHPLDFIRQLLIRLPGAEWTVEHEVVRREVEDVGECHTIENCDNTKNTEEIITRYDLSCNCIESTAIRKHHVQGADDIDKEATQCAWSSGTFEPDENYRKTVNVFTCRRLSREATSASIVLDRDRVRQHVEQCCNEWYKITNPMVTDEREREIAISFSRATGASNDSRSLDLKQCYDALFTKLEQEHLPYEYFLEDWEAYCSNHDDVKVRDRMTLELALNFLREMQ